MNGLTATQVQGDIPAQARTPRARCLSEDLKQSTVTELKSMASVATDDYAESCGVGHHLEPCWMLVGHAAAGAKSIWLPCIATWGHGDIMVPAENHVWVFDPTTAAI